MNDLVDLILVEPVTDVDEKIRFKHSNVACELLTSDLDLISDALLEPQLLNKLYSFLESEKQLNPLLASFFSKTMSLLSVKRTAPLLRFLQTKDNFVQLILHHIETSAIMDFLLKLVTVDNEDMRSEIVQVSCSCHFSLLTVSRLQWLSSKELVPQVVAIFARTEEPDKVANAAQFLCDVVKAVREQQSLLQEKATPNALLDEIESYVFLLVTD